MLAYVSERLLIVQQDYYARAYSVVPTHPMILLSIGIAYLHRSMQRQANNRQLQILQAMYFFFEYRKYKIHGQEGAPKPTWLDEQEAEFNVARAFQQIGMQFLLDCTFMQLACYGILSYSI